MTEKYTRLEEAKNERSQAWAELQSLAAFATWDSGSIRDAICGRAGGPEAAVRRYTPLLSAAETYADAAGRLESEVKDIAARVAAAEREFDRLRELPPPLPGSSEFAQVKSKVERLEAELPEQRQILERFRYDEHASEFHIKAALEKAPEGRRRLAFVILELYAHDRADSVREAIRDARDAAGAVVRRADEYRDFLASVAHAVGDVENAPTIEFNRSAWEACARGDDARVVMPNVVNEG